MGCLWISRNVIGVDDPISDNVSANVIGLLLANTARFFLFRELVFLHPDRFNSTDRSTTDPVPPSTHGRAGG
jgi:hypothetical protein